MRTAVILLLIFLPTIAFADTFVVTSNADSGPGTLRGALQKANDNGIAVRDSIIFNLAAGVTDRTITISGTLVLSSNLVIDGSSEPATPFGVSGARIRITSSNGCLAGMSIYRLTDVAIFGIWISDFIGSSTNCFGVGISLSGSKNFIFGKPHAGNVLTNNLGGIAENGYYADYGPLSDSTANENITLQSNFIGLDTLGESSELAGQLTGVRLGVCKNVTIGGSGADEGNYVGEGYISAGDNTYQPAINNGFVKIINNIIGINYKQTIYNIYYSGIGIEGRNLQHSDFIVTIEGNKFGTDTITSPLEIDNISGNITVNHNFFGQPRNGASFFEIGSGILFNNCVKKDSIAVFDNIISGFTYGISAIITPGITIRDNKIYCNLKGIFYYDLYNIHTQGVPVISITQLTPNSITGLTIPNGKVQIFSTDSCQEYCENGKTLLANVTADNAGKFFYAGPVSGLISATVTSNFGTTSEFNGVKLDTVYALAKNATCGKNNGSITGIKILNASSWYWEDSVGNKISTDTNLVNLAPGKYRLLLFESNVSCIVQTGFYTVLAEGKPNADSAFNIVNPTCGLSTGSITFTDNQSFNTYASFWLNDSGKTIQSYANNIQQLSPGKYFFKLALRDDSTCFFQFGPIKLTNQSGPTLKTDSIQITNASCNNSNGAIKNISYQNATGNTYTAWEDSLGNIVSNAIDLANVAAGKYRLIFEDGSGCDTIVTNYYTIADEGVIKLDTTNLQTSPSTCKGTNGSITGITSTNATIYTWVNTATGNTVGNNENLIGVPAGNYQLTCSNSYGCKVSTANITVAQAGFLADTVLNVIIWDANCNLNNGYITINQFTKDSSLYSFEWVDSATNNIISINTNINNLTPGFYKLYATDTGGCKQQIFAARITQQGKPQFDYSQLKIVSDTCNKGVGAILFQSNNPNNYTWTGYNIAGQPQSTSPLGIINLTAGQYYATLTDQYTCRATSDTFTVNNIDVVPPAPQATDQLIPRGTQATIIVTNVQPGTYNLFDTVTATIPISTSATGAFTTPSVYYDKQFYIQNVQGDCASPMQPVWVKVFDSTIISVPNAFSPNGDGINDIWRFTVQGVVNEYNLTVFNRYGQALFTSNEINKPWDGTVSGKPLPVGTYYYIIQAKDNNNKPIKQSGFVVILR